MEKELTKKERGAIMLTATVMFGIAAAYGDAAPLFCGRVMR